MSRTYYDVTLPYSPDLPAWPGESKPVIRRINDMDEGDGVNVSRIDACVHFGTHVDAPVHFIDGDRAAESLDVAVMVGPALVVEFPDAPAITADMLEGAGIPHDVDRILFKTRNSELWNNPAHDFFEDFAAIAADGAQWLVDRGVRLVGVDYLSIESFHTTDFAVHKTILGAGIVAVEGLDLRPVSGGVYEMACLPMKIVGADGAPARVVLWRDD